MKFVDLVLIVEDNPIDVFINTRVVEQSGLSKEVMAIQSAREALEFLNQRAENSKLPDIIFLDIRMPDLDGFEFLEEFSELPERVLELCKIVMLSSTIDPIELEKARNSPFVLAFIPKPLTRDKIIELFD
jgi:CheY-like chemotaxis protein